MDLMDLKVDLGQEGLGMMFLDYQILMLRHAWNVAVGTVELTTAELCVHVNRVLKESDGERKSISRSSVIKSAQGFYESGIWGYHEASCKGGYRRLYRPIMTEEELLETVRTVIIDRFNLALEKVRGKT